jgi:hemoglobin-like flavoprotein
VALLFFFKRYGSSIRDSARSGRLTDFIHQSFELAAQRCEDLTPLVYARLFREHPETQSMFRSQGSDLIKGSMLALTIDAMLDFSGQRTGRFRMISCEVQSHDAYGTSPELFSQFFGVIAATVREVLESNWSPEFDDAWQALLIDLERSAIRSD